MKVRIKPVEIIKDHRKWEVTHTFTNENCPYLFYPLNYHGCELLPEDKNECTYENCQYITSVIMETKKEIQKCKYDKNAAFINVELFAGELTPMCKQCYINYSKSKQKSINEKIEQCKRLVNNICVTLHTPCDGKNTTCRYYS